MEWNGALHRLFFSLHTPPPLQLISFIGGKHRLFLQRIPFPIQSSWCQCTKSSIVPLTYSCESHRQSSAVWVHRMPWPHYELHRTRYYLLTIFTTIAKNGGKCCWEDANGMGDWSYYILCSRNKLAAPVLSLAGGGSDNPFAFTDKWSCQWLSQPWIRWRRRQQSDARMTQQQMSLSCVLQSV